MSVLLFLHEKGFAPLRKPFESASWFLPLLKPPKRMTKGPARRDRTKVVSRRDFYERGKAA